MRNTQTNAGIINELAKRPVGLSDSRRVLSAISRNIQDN